MTTLNKQQLSAHRQHIGKLLRRIDYLSKRCLFDDPLIHGSPTTVFRKCGRKGCKCNESEDSRHGPYKVIQVVRNGHSRQVYLRKEQEKLWQMAKNYQYQADKLLDLKQRCQELIETVTKVIQNRTMEFP